ncbi:hypothetical protein [Paludibaculum fermentans]|uniref:hypothetical protein n=1 Tax=Paludibaculum fermentans TaxID=1473598 RepID=UPI003EBB25B3
MMKNNPLAVGPLAMILALTGIAVLPSTASAQAGGQGQDTTVVDASTSGRAPGFPESLETGYVPAAPNSLGITMIFLSYRNDPTAQPQIKVYIDNRNGDAEYWGFNDDGVWLSNPNLVPKSGGKPFTVRIVDGKAVIQGREDIPRGLRNPSNAYLAYYGPAGEKPAAAVASTGKGAGGSGQPRRPLRPGILNNPDVAEVLSTVGRGDTTRGRPAAIEGTKATVDASGLLTFQGSDNKTQGYKVERVSQGVQEPGKPLMGAYLYTAPDKNSGILFTLVGTPDGKVSGMPLNGQALGMLKPKSTGQ